MCIFYTVDIGLNLDTQRHLTGHLYKEAFKKNFVYVTHLTDLLWAETLKKDILRVEFIENIKNDFL